MPKETILVVAAHPDDEVLGCGGSIAWHTNRGDNVIVLILADGVTSRKYFDKQEKNSSEVELRQLNAKNANDILGVKELVMLSYPDNQMDSVPLLDVVQEIECLINIHNPSVIYTHSSSDVNIDHCVVHDAVIVACRPQPSNNIRELLFFEIPSSTEWRPPASRAMFSPNWHINISDTLAMKLEALAIYESELREFPHSRSIAAVEYLARWRDASVGLDAAEAFELGRFIQR